MNKLALVCLQTTLSRQKVNKSIMRANTWKSNSKTQFFLLKHVPTSSEMFLFPADRSPQTQPSSVSWIFQDMSEENTSYDGHTTLEWLHNQSHDSPLPVNHEYMHLGLVTACTQRHVSATAAYWTAKQWIYPICPFLVKIYMHQRCFL